MRIELDSLEGTNGRFTHEYEPGELALNDDRVHLTGPLTISGRISRPKNKVMVEGKISGRAQVECDRCLKQVELPVESDFRVEYVTAREYDALSAAELDETDLSLSVFDGEVLDIDELVREQSLLSIPSRVLCQEGCKGLCPVCGIDRNVSDCNCETSEVDPRWGALKELVDGK